MAYSPSIFLECFRRRRLCAAVCGFLICLHLVYACHYEGTCVWTHPSAGPLRLVRTEQQRYVIDGNPVIEASGDDAIVVPLDLKSRPSPVVQLELTGTEGARPLTVRAVVDTGGQDWLMLDGSAVALIRPWVWPESRGRVKSWAMGRIGRSWAVCNRVRIGNALYHYVPASIPDSDANPAKGGGSVSLGMNFLRTWACVRFDWQGGRLVLMPRGKECLSISPGAVDVPYELWHPMGHHDEGFVSVDVTLEGCAPVKAVVDTGMEVDFALPASLLGETSWRSRLQLLDSVQVVSASGRHDAGVYWLSSALHLGAQSFSGVRVLVFDDSNRPEGSEVRPLVGVTLLRHFAAVTFDFSSGSVRFEPRPH
jgi:hypothetical protein